MHTNYDSSDESASERQNLLSEFLSHGGTSSTNSSHAREQRPAGTVAAEIKLPSRLEVRPPSPPSPKARRLRREPLVDSPNPSMVDHTLTPQSNNRGQAPRKRGRPPRAQQTIRHVSRRSPETDGSMIPTGASRSRRSRGRPVNYYAKSSYSGYTYSSESDNNNEGEEQELVEVRGPVHQQPYFKSMSARPQAPAPQQHKPTPRAIYITNNLRICRSSFKSFDDIADLPRKAPYAPEDEPSKYAQRYIQHQSRPILHVAFSRDETEGMLGLLTLFSVETSLPDMSLADQIIHIVNSMPTSRLEQCIVSLVNKMMKVQRLFNRHGLGTISDFYEGIRPSKRKTRNAIESLLSEISQSNASLDPSQWLAMAAKLKKRRGPDVSAFISDVRRGSVPTNPYYIVASRNHTNEQHCLRGDRMSLRQRRYQCSNYNLHRNQTWKGASNDVISLAWSPDGAQFAVGAAAHCDEHNMQYNRPNNLLLGDTVKNCIRELPDHRVPYPSANPNNRHLYMSVSAVQWFGDVLYTASYDKTVKLWNVSSFANVTCTRTLQHDFRVQVMARPHNHPQILATGTDSTLHLWHMDTIGDTSQSLDFAQQRSIKNVRTVRNVDLLPSALAWGSDFLAAGFSGKEAYDGDPCREGLLAMWKMTESSMEPIQLQPNAQNIFDVKFHPVMPWLITGSSISPMGTNGGGKNVRSLVRLYEPKKKSRCSLEFDCPALDINDVNFCPMDRNIVSASCTDGVTYVWDLRNPGQILHRLCHGDALNQLDEQLTREQADVGVRVALWGDSIDTFITGGSDGVLKSWNVLRAPEDVLVRDIATVENEIMSGAFSPDKSTLLVGDDSGGIHVFAKGAPADVVRNMDFDYANSNEEQTELPSDSGRSIARQLLSTGQLVHKEYGVFQGPAYKGPYAAWARPEGTPADMLAVTALLEEVQLQQLDTPSPGTQLEEQRRIAEVRNKTQHKRKRQPDKPEDHTMVVVNLCSDDEDQQEDQKPRRILIDLTGDTDMEDTEPEDNDSNDSNNNNNDITVDYGFGVADGESESDLEDYWFPDSRDVDANIKNSSD